MSLFDETLVFDVRHGFLNPAEFGGAMSVDGLETVGIWDDGVDPAESHYDDDVDTWGVNQVRRTLYLPSGGDDGIPLPSPRQELDIDGVLWTVADADDQHGVVKIALYRNGS